MPVSEVYKLINAIDNNKTEFNSPLPIRKELRNLVNIPEPNESIDELKQQIERIEKLLNHFIKNPNSTNKINEISEEINEEISEEINEEISEEINEEISEEINEEISEEINEEISEEIKK